MSDDAEELAPLPQHVLDMVPPPIHQLFRDILKYRVDPNGEYYGITLDKLTSALTDLQSTNVVAIGSNPEDFKYQEKGHMYDPILQSFVQGSGGRISNWSKEENNMVPVVLRGITKRKEMEQCKAVGRDFYYIDTGYFGNGKKKTFHRVTKNDVQNFGPIIDRPSDRVAKCNLQLSKFRRDGSKILLAPPSQKLLNLYNINLEQWMEQTIATLKQHTDREIVVRLKQGRSVRQSTDTMQMALQQDIWCLVTYSSIAAGEALLCGKPAITLGPNAAGMLCSQRLEEIENPRTPTLDEVEAWTRHIAYCQFTEPEMRDGTAWRILNDC
jgi:hypothetical protein